MKFDSADIQSWLDGSLPQAERQEFKDRLAVDAQLQQAVEQAMRLREQLQLTALGQKIEEIGQHAWDQYQKDEVRFQRSKKKALLMAIGVIMVGAALWIIFGMNTTTLNTNPNNPEKSNQQQSPGAVPTNLLPAEKNVIPDLPAVKKPMKTPPVAQILETSKGHEATVWRGEAISRTADDSLLDEVNKRFYHSPIEEIGRSPQSHFWALAHQLLLKNGAPEALASGSSDTMLLLRGAYYYEKGDFEKAEQAWTRIAYKKTAIRFDARRLLALAYFAQNERKLALDLLQLENKNSQNPTDSMLLFLIKTK